MVLCRCNVQGIRSFQPETRAQIGGMQVGLVRDLDNVELPEPFLVIPLQNDVAGADGGNEALEHHERRDGEAAILLTRTRSPVSVSSSNAWITTQLSR